MKPAPPDSAELLNRVRQQLILAQVRIMELEDARDELAPRLAATEKLLAQAQTIADAKLDESAHLEKVRADLQAQFEHMRHMQHVTNEALQATRDQLATATATLQTLTTSLGTAQSEAAHHAQKAAALERDLVAATANLAARQARLEALAGDLHATKSSRSWRWTSWLRALERALSGR